MCAARFLSAPFLLSFAAVIISPSMKVDPATGLSTASSTLQYAATKDDVGAVFSCASKNEVDAQVVELERFPVHCEWNSAPLSGCRTVLHSGGEGVLGKPSKGSDLMLTLSVACLSSNNVHVCTRFFFLLLLALVQVRALILSTCHFQESDSRFCPVFQSWNTPKAEHFFFVQVTVAICVAKWVTALKYSSLKNTSDLSLQKCTFDHDLKATEIKMFWFFFFLGFHILFSAISSQSVEPTHFEFSMKNQPRRCWPTPFSRTVLVSTHTQVLKVCRCISIRIKGFDYVTLNSWF